MDTIKFYVEYTSSAKPSLPVQPEVFEKLLKDNSVRVSFSLFSRIGTCGLLHLKGKVLRQS